MVTSPSSTQAVPAPWMPVERNAMVGRASTSRNSGERTWASRSALPVSIEARATVAVTEVASMVGPTTRAASTSPKRPRTLDTPR